LQLRPDTLLFVYCLEGRISRRPAYPEGFLGNWEEEEYSYLFFVSEADPFVAALAEGQGLEWVERYTIEYGQWQADFSSPVEVGGLQFLPWWSQGEKCDQRKTIYLDTGVVLGDGLHPTTRACLCVMQEMFSTRTIRTMLDLGTGSGILALAAVKFGCRRVAAVDNTFLAVQTAWRNIVLNTAEKEILPINGRAEEVFTGPSDLLVANIQPAVIHRILDSVMFPKTKGFILSGIQHHEADLIAGHLRDTPGVLLGRIDSGGAWQTMWGEVESGK
jgi:ribosomal protein L11 methyltransferase